MVKKETVRHWNFVLMDKAKVLAFFNHVPMFPQDFRKLKRYVAETYSQTILEVPQTIMARDRQQATEVIDLMNKFSDRT